MIELVAHALVFVALGAAFGFLGGMFGIGGGIVAIPILGIFFGLNEQVAQGTATLMVVPNVLVGLYKYLQAVKLDWRIVIALIVPALPVTALASHIATILPSRDLRFAFAVFTVLLALYVLWRATRPVVKADKPPASWPWALLLGAGAGTLSGFFTIGGAIFSVPFLTGAFGMSQLAAQATSLAFGTPGIILSLGVFAHAGDVDWSTGIALALGGVLAVPYGVGLARRLPDRMLRLAFVGFLVLCAAGLFARASAA
jgi:uncharacterized membrane protein YfcA